MEEGKDWVAIKAFPSVAYCVEVFSIFTPRLSPVHLYLSFVLIFSKHQARPAKGSTTDILQTKEKQNNTLLLMTEEKKF